MFCIFLLPVPTLIVNVTSNNENPHGGDDIILTCVIVLDPAVDTDVIVTVVWTTSVTTGRNLTGSLPTDPDSDGTYKSTLEIISVEASDSGEYGCAAIATSDDMSDYVFPNPILGAEN